MNFLLVVSIVFFFFSDILEDIPLKKTFKEFLEHFSYRTAIVPEQVEIQLNCSFFGRKRGGGRTFMEAIRFESVKNICQV